MTQKNNIRVSLKQRIHGISIPGAVKCWNYNQLKSNENIRNVVLSFLGVTIELTLSLHLPSRQERLMTGGELDFLQEI